jgi:hypothetical protein
VDLAVDARTLVAELSRERGHRLVSDGRLTLSISEHVWSEVRHELPRRFAARVRHGSLTTTGAADLHRRSLALVARSITIFVVPAYEQWEDVARRRVPRDPNDWPTVALALTLGSGIWTADADFLGCGVPTWTTETLQLHLDA